MNITEFKERLNKLEMQYGYGIELLMPDDYYDLYRVKVNYNGLDYYTCSIDKDYAFDISTRSQFIRDCHNENFKSDLLDVVIEFAKTPIDEREDERRYKYRLKEKYAKIIRLWRSTKKFEDYYLYTARAVPGNFLDLILRSDSPNVIFKDYFTDREIKLSAKNHDIDLSLFEKIEVREDE